MLESVQPIYSLKKRRRQKAFNERLGQLFQERGEMVTRQSLIAGMSEFTSVEVDQCLATLSNKCYIMVSEGDGMIYKI